MDEIWEDDAGDVRLNSFITLDTSQPFWQRSAATSSSGRQRSTPPVSIKSPDRLPVNPTKRRQKTPCYEPVYVESCLMQLCRDGKWDEILRRCQEHPEETNLVPLRGEAEKEAKMDDLVEERFHCHSSRRMLGSSCIAYGGSVEVFRETPLGIVCASEEIEKSCVISILKALVEANPQQVGASQLLPGHTALRDAIINSSCPPEVLEILIKASITCDNGAEVFCVKDRGGMSLIEHLISAVQVEMSSRSMEKFKIYMRMKPSRDGRSPEDRSPLIYLLTTGNSANIRGSLFEHCISHADGDRLMEPVLQMTEALLDDDPTLLSLSSQLSQCSALHAALRNYGTYEPLIRELIHRDASHQLVQHRNMYGDLPLHVACSVGVPYNILLLVLEETAKVPLDMRNTDIPFTLNPLIWSTNKSGFTPIDLEWVRVIESNNDFLTARTFYPLEVTGVRRHCFKQDEYYKDLLREAVSQVMQDSTNGNGTKAREEGATLIFGNSIDRISILIKASSYFGNPGNKLKSSEPASLFDVCKLCRVYNASLPLPILELFLWLRSEDILKVDADGKIPLHHLLRGNKVARGCSIVQKPKDLEDWKSFVFRMIDTRPEQAKVPSGDCSLPLHVILERSVDVSRHMAVARHEIVEKLVKLFPEAVEQLDPVSRLYPFMMAANDPNLTVDTVFSLLRHAPSQCPSDPTN